MRTATGVLAELTVEGGKPLARQKCRVVSPKGVYCSGGQENDLRIPYPGANTMSKGMDSKKQTKKEPAKSMLEKRAAKKAKKSAKGAIK